MTDHGDGHAAAAPAPTIDLDAFQAVTFDFYGTLVDWEPDVLAFLRNWLGDAARDLPDEALLAAYDRLRQPIQREQPAPGYSEVLRRTLDAMAREFDCALPPALREAFGDIAATHRAFPDTRDTVAALRARGLVLGALSNIDEASFAAVLALNDLTFDVVVTAERVGAYKPAQPHFLTALADLRARGIEPDAVLHVAQSKRADIVPATALGLTCVWVDRPGHVFGRRGSGAEDARATYRITSLRELIAN